MQVGKGAELSEPPKRARPRRNRHHGRPLFPKVGEAGPSRDGSAEISADEE